MEGLEPPRLSAPDPKSGAATNYATSAERLPLNKGVQKYIFFVKQEIREKQGLVIREYVLRSGREYVYS